VTALGLGGFGVLLGLAWLAPNHYPPWLSAYLDTFAAAAALTLGVMVSTERRMPLAAPGPAVFIAAVALVPATQGALGLIAFAGDAWIVVMYLLCAAATVTWSAQAARIDAARWTSCFAVTIVAAALLSSVILGIQRWAIDAGPADLFILAVPPGYAPFANLGQPNQLATLLALGLASLLFLYERRALAAAYAVAAAAVLTLALVITQSRTGLLLWTVAVAWHWVFARRVGLRTPRLAIVLFALGWLVLYPLWPRLVTVMGFENLASAASRLRPGPRPVLWSQMLEAIGSRPWLGYGWNQTSFAQVPIAAHSRSLRFADSAHNLVLDLAIWNGVPLALAIVGVATWWLLRAGVRLRSVPAAFAFLTVLLFLAHSMVEFPLYFLYFLVPFAIAIGIVSDDVKTDRTIVLPSAARLAAPLAFAVVAGIATIDYARVEDSFRDMRFAIARFGRPMPSEAPAPLHTEFSQLAALYRFSLLPLQGPVDAPELAWMRDVAYRYPYSPTLHRYALAQALSGDLTGAQSTLAALRNMYGDGPYAASREELLRLGQTQPILRRLVLPAPAPASASR
jgi:O-antigen ligase